MVQNDNCLPFISSNVVGDDHLLPLKRIMLYATKKLMIIFMIDFNHKLLL